MSDHASSDRWRSPTSLLYVTTIAMTSPTRTRRKTTPPKLMVPSLVDRSIGRRCGWQTLPPAPPPLPAGAIEPDATRGWISARIGALDHPCKLRRTTHADADPLSLQRSDERSPRQGSALQRGLRQGARAGASHGPRGHRGRALQERAGDDDDRRRAQDHRDR